MSLTIHFNGATNVVILGFQFYNNDLVAKCSLILNTRQTVSNVSNVKVTLQSSNE